MPYYFTKCMISLREYEAEFLFYHHANSCCMNTSYDSDSKGSPLADKGKPIDFDNTATLAHTSALALYILHLHLQYFFFVLFAFSLSTMRQEHQYE